VREEDAEHKHLENGVEWGDCFVSRVFLVPLTAVGAALLFRNQRLLTFDAARNPSTGTIRAKEEHLCCAYAHVDGALFFGLGRA